MIIYVQQQSEDYVRAFDPKKGRSIFYFFTHPEGLALTPLKPCQLYHSPNCHCAFAEISVGKILPQMEIIAANHEVCGE